MRMFWLLYLTALSSVVYGLWDHDWRTIFAGFLLMVVWPFIMEGVESVAHERAVDELWDDDDLSRSA